MEYTILILALPILSFLILALTGMYMKHRIAGLIGTLSLAGVTILSYLTAINYFTAPRTAEGVFPTLTPWNIQWLPFTESLHIDMGILLDPISVMMLVVISTVSLMVHIYSFGYMKGEKGFQRYYAFLSLFTFSMLGLVLATNIFQMYVFWELVGVSSYLLIGFYYTKPEAIAASKKAFIVTRFADLGFLIGILIYGYYMQTFTFTPGEEQLMKAGMVLPWALGLMFVGGAGKSAMFPLHIWLPDAMEGPTPVSALIHAATMVVAGVYLVARTYFIIKDLQAKLSYEKAYRLPTTEELFGDEDLEAGKADLKPERSDNFNLNLSYAYHIGKHAIYVEGSLIYRDTKDYIKRGLSQVSNMSFGYYENHGRGKTKGYNISLRYNYSRWFNIGGTFNSMNARDEEKYRAGGTQQESLTYGQRIPNQPYLYANFDASFTWHDLFAKGNVLTLGYDGYYQHEFPLYWENLGDPTTKIRVPEQISHNLSIGYSLKGGRYNLSFECRNLTNAKLYDNFSLQKAGRAFYGKIRVNFGK